MMKTGTWTRRTRAGLARRGAGPWERLRSRAEDLLQSPLLTTGIAAVMIFVLCCGILAIWVRTMPLVAVGQVMNDTRTVRVRLAIEDKAGTEAAREAARQQTPRVYVADVNLLEEITLSLGNLPQTLAQTLTLGEVDPTIREQYALDTQKLDAIRAEAIDGQPSTAWKSRVEQFRQLIQRRPIVDAQTWQRATQEGRHAQINLVVGSTSFLVPRGEILDIDDKQTLVAAVENTARDAGFVGPLRSVVVARFVSSGKPTFRPDPAASTDAQNAAAGSIRPVIQESPVGQVIFARGDVLTQTQYDLYKAELVAHLRESPSWQIMLRRAALLAVVAGIAIALAGYVGLFVPQARRSAPRVLGLSAVLVIGFAISAFGLTAFPHLAWLFIPAPTMLVAAVLVIAYGQRAALGFSVLFGVMTCLALDQSVGMFCTVVAAIAVAVWQLKSIRDRYALLRMGLVGFATLGSVALLVGLIERPITPVSLRQLALDSVLSAGGALGVAGVVLFVLPIIERVFDVATGLTLIELRDPKQPLLRELQLRAPGTYNHSLNVASIAEAAAAAIGADSLLTYVGSLYHDVGKMNKPDYFVENQAGGPNKHDKLSPAMSLLIIIGHVKDGMELAREFGVPRPLHHFIESHHGTTLVEFFYHRAKQQALKQASKHHEERPEEPDQTHIPEEFEYRYPGPKPRTKEVAILLIADAVESATRTLSDPTPARIDALVRAIGNKRLLDGQFDECDLSLRELREIMDSISRTVSSIYHGRLVYPSGLTGGGSGSAIAAARAAREEEREPTRTQPIERPA
jgi:cyclic-di-AMP phosphodiesterase PgpH